MARQELSLELFGKKASLEYSERWIGQSILGLRVLMAWVFIQAGLEKILDPEWTAVHFLEGVESANPFMFLFEWFAAYPGLVDPLVMWTQLLIGLALLLGVFFRFAALGGAIQMLMFWLASFEAGLMAGFPVAHGYLVNDTLVYAVLLFGLGALGAGRLYGLDSKLEETDLVKENNWIRYLLG